MRVIITLQDKKNRDNKVDAAAFFVEQDFSLSTFKDSVQKYCPDIEKLIKDKRFTGKKNSVFVTPVQGANFGYIIFLGLGKKDKNNVINFENYRRALGKLVRTTPCFSIKSVNLELPQETVFGVSGDYLVKNTAITTVMAGYHFDTFLTEGDEEDKTDLAINILVDAQQESKFKSGLDTGLIVGDAVNDARSWVDLPSNKMTPADLAAHAKEIANDYNLKCQIFSEDEVNKMGMGGLSAVASGSEKDCKFVILEYHTNEKNAPTIGFVGKGITFDSGGLSIKPAVHMETMKEDMSGAAAVIASMKALGQLKPKVNIIAIAPITENMPSGTSVKPGDIVTFYNGKTAEIKNTDAEGRLVLADALSYITKHYKLDALIDLATLTGACAYALGPFFSGLFSEHDDFTKRVTDAAGTSGDYVWRLPLTDDYKPAVKCEVADLCNIGKKQYQAGATTAACFLQYFVADVPWVHLDIAGTAFNVPDVNYYQPYSATGVGVRLLVDLAMNWKV